MKQYVSDMIVGIKPSGIRKFFDLANEIPGVVSLGVGEPDFPTPAHIRDAGDARLSGRQNLLYREYRYH